MGRTGFILIALLILALYGGLCYYIGARIFQWLKLLFPNINRTIFIVLFAFVAFSMILAILSLPMSVKSFLGAISAYWMGIFVYLLLFFLAVDIILLIGSLVKIIPAPMPQNIRFYASLAAILLTIGTVSYGLYNANQIKLVSYEIPTKETKMPVDMNIVLISDLHLGAINSERRLEKIVNEINQLEPDLVCIAGDIFNDDFTALKDPERAIELFQSIQATYGVYGSLGNHDGGATFDQMIDFLEKSNVKMLHDEYVIIDDRLVLFGRVDPSPIRGFGDLKRKDITEMVDSLEDHLPIVVMDHTPINLEQYSEKVDLVLSGHTHKGQIFPGSLITNAIFVVDHGHYQKDANSPHFVVSSGAGTWGPPMRVGTNSEVVSIHLQ